MPSRPNLAMQAKRLGIQHGWVGRMWFKTSYCSSCSDNHISHVYTNIYNVSNPTLPQTDANSRMISPYLPMFPLKSPLPLWPHIFGRSVLPGSATSPPRCAWWRRVSSRPFGFCRGNPAVAGPVAWGKPPICKWPELTEMMVVCWRSEPHWMRRWEWRIYNPWLIFETVDDRVSWGHQVTLDMELVARDEGWLILRLNPHNTL